MKEKIFDVLGFIFVFYLVVHTSHSYFMPTVHNDPIMVLVGTIKECSFFDYFLYRCD